MNLFIYTADLYWDDYMSEYFDEKSLQANEKFVELFKDYYIKNNTEQECLVK